MNFFNHQVGTTIQAELRRARCVPERRVLLLRRDQRLCAGTGFTAAAQVILSGSSAMSMLKSAAATAGVPVGVRLDTIILICSNVGAGITAIRVVAMLDNISRWGFGPGGSTMTFSANGHIGS
jgi:hypothetical protein